MKHQGALLQVRDIVSHVGEIPFPPAFVKTFYRGQILRLREEQVDRAWQAKGVMKYFRFSFIMHWSSGDEGIGEDWHNLPGICKAARPTSYESVRRDGRVHGRGDLSEARLQWQLFLVVGFGLSSWY